MKMFWTLILFSVSLIVAWSQPPPAILEKKIIVDTDCGIDDMRAISLLLARPEITLMAVTTSDGSLIPQEGAKKVCSLLREFGRDSIPIAYGDIIEGVNPQWRQFNIEISWGDTEGCSGNFSKQIDRIYDILRDEADKTTMICLGPLTNIAKVLRKEPSLGSKIERIIWYNDSIGPLGGFNYECDRESADFILNSRIRIDVISCLDKYNTFFDKDLYDLCGRSDTRLAHVLYSVFSQKPAHDRLIDNHFRLYDDLIVLYLTNPELFSINRMTGKLNVRYNSDYNVVGIREALSDMIKGVYSSEHNIVFNRFPAESDMFNYDVRPIIDSAIAMYGMDEWKANVMTDEFHGHLGVFSIVGAKMGILARELFGVGPDELVVTSYAGSKPPYSCLNDGIQVSTGATLGMGTIHLSTDSLLKPSAIFTHNSRSVKLTLKKEFLDQVEADIDEGIVKFGLLDDGYWKLIRSNALKYWLKWDRKKIFDIEYLNPYSPSR
jgi:pyrimidine-specific ribonucleoside hydrolase